MALADQDDLWDLEDRSQVIGCTVLLNRACLEAALPIPKEAVLHDWWLALVAQRAGGLRQLLQATFSHRLHGSWMVLAAGALRAPSAAEGLWAFVVEALAGLQATHMTPLVSRLKPRSPSAASNAGRLVR